MVVATGVRVGVGVTVGDGDGVGVCVCMGVGVGVRVGVGDGEGVCVGVGVLVKVGVGDGNGVWDSQTQAWCLYTTGKRAFVGRVVEGGNAGLTELGGLPRRSLPTPYELSLPAGPKSSAVLSRIHCSVAGP